jgi:oligopeptide/dipeptide ABC transporter, ATP-binding protein, C-terminal domain
MTGGVGLSHTLIDIKDLSVDMSTPKGNLNVINRINLTINKGEIVCLVGESGSGKTVTSLSIMRLIDYQSGKITTGEILLEGKNLAQLSGKEMNHLRGKKIAMVFQEPMTALDPVFTIGHQISEVLLRHTRTNKVRAREEAIRLLKKVGIPEPEIRYHQYPHELSGGMRQRAMIAVALACGPELLIADEPTTALDVTVQAQILALLKSLCAEMGMSILLITHDLGIAAEIADRVVVMYAGKIVEQSATEPLFRQPLHPYTKGLLRSVVRLDQDRTQRLYSIPGSIPSLNDLPTGCRFHPRCEYASERCSREEPPLLEQGDRLTACWHADRLLGEGAWQEPVRAEPLTTKPKPEAGQPAASSEALIEINDLKKHFPIKKQLFLFGRKAIRAVDGVTFEIYKGETFGLVGESGCGKSTLGRVLLQLEKATGGSVKFDGQDLFVQGTKPNKAVKKDMQVVFQDPYSSINPRWKIVDVIGEPLAVHLGLKGRQKREKVQELMELVGLNPSWCDKYPHEFSGGQRQRIGIARAIALNPKFILADEAVSALDVSVQSQVINLFQDLQAQLNLTYLFIAHGLTVVRHISNRIGVMYLGKLVELAPTDELFAHPAHPYTRALLSAIPDPSPNAKKAETITLSGEIPSPANPPSGCRFHTRCPAATAKCREAEPPLTPVADGHFAACHYPC